MKYYNSLLQNDSGALKRALYKSMGFTDEALQKPLVAVVNSYTNATPGHFNLNALSEQVQKGIEAAGGTAMTFSTIAPCDGIAEGHIGMRYVLPARDVIADSVECMVRAHKFDAMVLIGSCDKIVPGMLMAAARLDIPSIFLNGGPMYPAEYKGKHYDGNIVTEAVGWKKQGKVDEEEFKKIENIAEPCAGSCAMLGTANTMGCIAEALGMSLPNSAMIPAVSAKRNRVAYETGRTVMDLVRKKITARKIMTKAAFENAIRVLMSIGGSTNAILHLQAIFHESGMGELPLSEFDRLSDATPQVASVYPASEYDVVDFYEAGGVPAVMLELKSLLNTACLTVTGETVEKNLSVFSETSRREVIHSIDSPFADNGGVAVLYGNLAPEGSIVKPAAVPEDMKIFKGRAKVFTSEDDAVEAILNGKIKKDTVLVLAYEGPKGGPGMPEMYRPMKSLEGMGLSSSCAIITDGRFSGSNRGCFVGHISPEASEGGTIAIVQDDDEVLIDIVNKRITLLISDEEIQNRRSDLKLLEKKVSGGVLSRYKKYSRSAANGAVIE